MESISNLFFISAYTLLQSSLVTIILVFFSDAATGAHLASGARVRDQTWETWTCPLGWHVQGIWKSYEAPSMQVSSVDRTTGSGVSELMESAGTVGSDVLMVVADEYGRIRLYRYPCVEKE